MDMTEENGMKKCRACGEEIKAVAKNCKHCGEMLEEAKTETVNATTDKVQQYKGPVLDELNKNKYLWAMAGVILLSVIVDFTLGTAIGLISCWAGLIACVFLDHKEAQEQELEPPSRLWVMISPVYVWKRLNLINDSKKIVFWVYVAVAVLTSFIGPEDTHEVIQSTAKEILNEQILPNMGVYAKCSKITNIRKAKPKLLKIEGRHDYTAVAHLRNGKTVKIDVFLRDDSDDVFVQIKP